MAFLVKIGHIPPSKSTMEYVDLFSFQNINDFLPGIKTIITNDEYSVIELSVNYIKEISLLPVDQTKDQETDYPLEDYSRQLDQTTFNKLIFTPNQNSITLTNGQTINNVLSVSIWHLDKNTADILIKYGEVGAGKKIIFDGNQPQTP